MQNADAPQRFNSCKSKTINMYIIYIYNTINLAKTKTFGRS